MFPARIDRLATGNDSTKVYYLNYRSKQRTGSVLGLVGIAVGIAGASMLEHGSNDAVGVGMLLGGYGLALGGTLSVRAARNQLSEAIWWHNRDFVPRP